MILETGNPVFDGRYVAYVSGVLDWLWPVIVTRSNGKWFYVHSTQEYPEKIHGWIGPLPALKEILDNCPFDPASQSEFPDEEDFMGLAPDNITVPGPPPKLEFDL